MLGGSLSWEILSRTFVGASIMGMFMAYYAERRDREMFLQSRLLQIAKWRTERYAEELGRLSREDGLTGLANRRHFDESLQREWRRAGRQKSSLAVLMIDVDNFKHFNDKLGHPEGDRCLQRVAKLLSAYARRPGELVARYGGEEFVMIFPDTDHQQAVNIAEHVLDGIREARIQQPDGLERWYVTISIGVSATVPSERLTPSRLLVASDQALYAAKRNGRNGWWYQSPETHSSTAVQIKDANWMM
jgi:diguanylate cyclase (GGDEF)-like protein